MIAALAVVATRQIVVPMRFENQKKIREKAVIEKISDIRRAQWSYRQAHGQYSDNFDTLARYVGTFSDDLHSMPYGDGAQFILQAGTLTTLSGVEVPVFECRAPYKIFLSGLDTQQLINLIDRSEKADKYPGIKVGSMEQATNDAGNWE